MSGPIESRPFTGIVSKKRGPRKELSTREYADDFLRRLFADGFHFEQCFRNICDAGCPSEEFGQFLWATCVSISGRPGPLVNAGKLSKAQLKSIPNKIRAVADLIRMLNASPLGPGNESKLAGPTSVVWQTKRDLLAQRYKMLPLILDVYANHVERFSGIMRSNLKRLTLEHCLTIEMLAYVEKHTGSPRYKEVADLLTQGCSIEQEELHKREDLPKFLTEEALAKLYRRWGPAVSAGLGE